MRTANRFGLLLVSSLWSSAAWAVEPAVVSTARDLAEQGLTDFDAGRYPDAADKLLKAYGMVRVPTTALNAARALEKAGKWVKASELYFEASGLSPNELWQGTVQQEAQRQADAERANLLAKMPKLQVNLEGAKAEEVRIAIDGVPLPSTVVGIEQFSDPGKHQVTGTRQGQTVEQTVEVKESERRAVLLRFESPVVAPIAPVAPANPPPPAPAVVPPQPLPLAAPLPAAPATPSNNEPSSQRYWAWGALGVGGLGLAVGATTGLLAWVKRSNMPAECRETNNCPSDADGVDSYNSLRTVSTVGFVVGVVAGATGAGLLLFESKPSDEQPRVGVAALPNGVSVRGAF